METFPKPRKIVATKGFFGPRTTPTKVAFGTKKNVVEGVFRPRTQFEGPRASFVISSSRINSCTQKNDQGHNGKKGMKKIEVNNH